MICPYCGHTLNFLTEVLALTQTGAQCPNCWNHLSHGRTLRVSSEVLAYQDYAKWAWSVLPVSALLELAGVAAFATNILGTFILEPSHAQKRPLVVEIR